MNIPDKLTSHVSIKDILKVENWWNELSDENKKELSSIYNQNEVEIDEKLVSIQLCGKFVEQEPIKSYDAFWINHFYEYLVNHEMIIDGTKPYFGTVCHHLSTAENSIRKGIISSTYQCPIQSNSCNIINLLKQSESGKSLLLYVKFKLLK
ncbi:hypothetical protein SAMN04489761_3864 [Tenacibaculum sp. MAR_2009_124]|uniref:hypothetical protein n=1 Tax=Tenacibaculum sp. MAR_2009_124 TaxID=1250059 RepID=UPI000899977C|nr:hypothetical protein [Tenacibaculum sp. MAR_2009_124]SEC88448.1 hypothetical protein SAMN04489761_3864 [Tenacibaculum sp. MAR_2009_124]